MFKNYFKTAVRNLFKNRLLSFINVSGLALGMAGAGLLLLNIQYELSVDQFHEKKDRVFKVYCKANIKGQLQTNDHTSAPMGPVLQKEHPQIKQVTRVNSTNRQFGYLDKRIQVSGYCTDESFLSMFSFPLLAGNIRSALTDPNSIVITESLAKKIFGSEDPVNKIIRLDNKRDVTVTGVLKDVPLNSSLQFEYLLPWEEKNNNWDYYFANTYVELKDADEVNAVNKQIGNTISRHTKNELGTRIFLHPVGKMHLQHHFDAKGNPETESDLYFLPILAAVMLLIGCINFMNLSTARSEKRAREVGVRKVMGAVKRALVIQFITESILLAFAAGVIALLIVQLVWPAFSTMAKVRTGIPWQSPAFWLYALGFICLTGILAGSYPAFYLSSFKPVKVLKGAFNSSHALITPRRILVVTQFVIAILLINFTIVFRKQVSHTEKRDPGFKREELIFHSLTADLTKHYNIVQQELMNTGVVMAVSKSNMPLTRAGIWFDGLEWAGGQDTKSVSFSLFTTSGNFVKANGLALVAGRDIDTARFLSDRSACIINETSARVLGFTNPVGQIIKDGKKNWNIVGVVKDFYQSAPSDATRPVLICYGKDNGVINIRMKEGNSSMQQISQVEQILKKYNPGYITELQFADADFANSFKQRKNVAVLINSFALIAIFIACMGLLGLTAYMAELRKREISIRKALGANVSMITSLLTKDFIKLVAIAVLIASPLAWLFMNSFLQQFSYRTQASWWILPLSGSITILIAVFTISFLALKAAVANPVNALRSE